MRYDSEAAELLVKLDKAKAQIRRLKDKVKRLKCCGNCEKYYKADEEICEGCCWPALNKWKFNGKAVHLT